MTIQKKPSLKKRLYKYLEKIEMQSQKGIDNSRDHARTYWVARNELIREIKKIFNIQ